MSRADDGRSARSAPARAAQAQADLPTSPAASGGGAAAEAAVSLIWRPGCASCAAAKQFLIDHGVPFESINPVEAEGQERWSELGRPRVPSMLLDGRITAIYHTSQVACLLGLLPAAQGKALRLAWDISTIVEAWSQQLAGIGFELMIAPTPSRSRSLRELTVNVHEPLRLMEVAWESGRFAWNTDRDEELAGELADAAALRAYAERRSAGWIAFLSGVGDELAERDPEILAGEEPLAFSALLDSQRFHAAFHYRQLLSFLAAEGAPPASSLDLAQLEGLRLPDAVF